MAENRNTFHFFAIEYQYIYPVGEVKLSPCPVRTWDNYELIFHSWFHEESDDLSVPSGVNEKLPILINKTHRLSLTAWTSWNSSANRLFPLIGCSPIKFMSPQWSLMSCMSCTTIMSCMSEDLGWLQIDVWWFFPSFWSERETSHPDQ